MSIAQVLEADLGRLQAALSRAKDEPGWPEVASELSQKLRAVQEAANASNDRGLLRALVGLAEATMAIRIRHAAKPGPFAELPVPQYDLAIPFKAVSVQGAEGVRFDAETRLVVNACISRLLKVVAAEDQALAPRDEQPAPPRSSDA